LIVRVIKKIFNGDNIIGVSFGHATHQVKNKHRQMVPHPMFERHSLYGMAQSIRHTFGKKGAS
jgi:hypothetical protein